MVVIDIGNSRIKWAQVVDGELALGGHVAHRPSLDAALEELEAALPLATRRVVVANVAGPTVASRLAASIAARFGIVTEFATTAPAALGVRCGYADPKRLGIDRWLSVLAAYQAAGGAACVISAGTAVTFDTVDAGGRHLGGLILPGPRLMAASLEQHTAGIGATVPPPGPPPIGLALLGQDTGAAVGHGAMLALAAAIDRAVAAVAAALSSPPVVYLTGGDAVALHDWLETRVELRPDLVLEGLALVALESRPVPWRPTPVRRDSDA